MEDNINKYYTLEAEEFYIGFEFEYLENETWVKKTLPFYNNYASLWSSNPDPKLFRVKYLDREDIESLGFTKGQTREDTTDFHKGECIEGASNDWHPQGNWKYRIMFSPSSETWIEKRNWNNGGRNTVFKGKIKNKSELIKLMKQLNVC